MFADVGQGKGAMGTLIYDPKFKAQMRAGHGANIKEWPGPGCRKFPRN